MKLRTQIIGGTVATVVGGIVLNFLGLVPFSDWFRAAWAGVVNAATWLGGGVAIPRWLVGALVLGALAGVGLPLYRWQATKSKSARLLAWYNSYREDKFFDMKWRWQWNENRQLQKLAAFCPRCDLGLKPRGPAPGEVPNVTFYCGECKVKWLQVQRPCSDIETDIQMHIGRNLRRRRVEEGKHKGPTA